MFRSKLIFLLKWGSMFSISTILGLSAFLTRDPLGLIISTDGAGERKAAETLPSIIQTWVTHASRRARALVGCSIS